MHAFQVDESWHYLFPIILKYVMETTLEHGILGLTHGEVAWKLPSKFQRYFTRKKKESMLAFIIIIKHSLKMNSVSKSELSQQRAGSGSLTRLVQSNFKFYWIRDEQLQEQKATYTVERFIYFRVTSFCHKKSMTIIILKNLKKKKSYFLFSFMVSKAQSVMVASFVRLQIASTFIFYWIKNYNVKLSNTLSLMWNQNTYIHVYILAEHVTMTDRRNQNKGIYNYEYI